MSQEDKQEAQQHMGRAGRQMKHAASNVKDAAVLEGSALVDDAKEVKAAAPQLSAKGLAAISGDTGTGFLALAVSLYSGAIAFHRFRSAFRGRGRAMR